MDSTTITEVVLKLVGEVTPYGSASIDTKRMENLKTLCEVTQNLVDKVNSIAIDNVKRYEYSMKQMGLTAAKCIEEIKSI